MTFQFFVTMWLPLNWITFSEDGNDKFSSRLHFADLQTRLTPIWNSSTFTAEFWREAGALNVTRDEVVADNVNGANAIGVAGVDAAVRAVRGNKRRYTELIYV